MNKQLKIILGAFLILIGVGYILDLLNIYILSFDGFFRTIKSIWPLFLVVIGLFILTTSKKIRVCVISIFLALLFAGTFYFTSLSHNNIFDNHYDFDFNEEYDGFSNFSDN